MVRNLLKIISLQSQQVEHLQFTNFNENKHLNTEDRPSFPIAKSLCFNNARNPIMRLLLP